jgi:alkylation response protein AidB-like acyl-CoA dehydrogenase
MDLNESPEHRALREEVRAFLAENATRFPKRAGLGRPSPEAVAWQTLLIERGYAARTIDRRYGGFGAEPDLLAARIIAEEFSRARAPRGLANQGVALLVPTLLELGSEEQKLRWVAPTLRGEIVWCQGYSEPEAGSDLASLRTSAVEDRDDFVINGQKIWTTTAHEADMMFCLVRTEPDAPKYKNLSYLLVPINTPGIEVRPLPTMTGAAEFNEVFLTDVRVPQTAIVGRRGDGWAVANATLKHERGAMGDPDAPASRLAAILELMKAETIDGVPVIERAEYRARAMRLQARVMAMKYHALRLLTASARGEDLRVGRLIVKLQATELNHQLSTLAVDVLGELGLLWQDSPLAREGGAWQTRALTDIGMLIGGGTAQIQKNIVAERGLGLPREPKLAKSP